MTIGMGCSPSTTSARLRPFLVGGLGLLVVAAMVLLLASPALAPAPGFPDVPSGHRYHEAIVDLATRGIINGYTDGSFGPGDVVIRQQFAKMVVLAGGYAVSELNVCTFFDVEFSGLGGFYPDNYVAVAAQHGITVGRTLTLFAPGESISRFQVVTMVVRAAEDLDPDLLADPPAGYQAAWDPALSPTHGQNARRAEYNGLLDGLPLEDLDPWDAMPRGEVAQVLHNLLVVLDTGSTTTTTSPFQLIPIPEIKGLDWESFLGKKTSVEGVFVRDPLPMLVTDLNVVRMKMPMPPDSYVLLGGTAAEALDPTLYGGKRLRVTGQVGVGGLEGLSAGSVPKAAAQVGGLAPIDLQLTDISYQVVGQGQAWAPSVIPMQMAYNPAPDPHKYAILFSGGIDLFQSHIAFWNDLVFTYRTLVGPLGFSPDHVIVLYSGGFGMDLSIPVDYAGTKANLAAAFDELRASTSEDDTVFVFFTNHGGGFWSDDPDADHRYGGAWDADADEPGEALYEGTYGLDLNGDGDKTDTVSWDEELCAWEWMGAPPVLDDDLQTMTTGIACDRMVVLITTCFGGGLIHDLAQGGARRIVMSTTGEHAPSYATSTDDGYYDDFGYHFTSALNKADPSGDPVDADGNGDGRVSVVEAYNYARERITTPETPHYEDSGDGIAHPGVMPGQGEGGLGSATWLEQ